MTDDRLRRIALIAEVISGIAIVVTLAFLAIEMRGNTNAIRAQTYQTLMQQLNDFRLYLDDPERIAADEKMERDGWDSLTRYEQQKIRIPAVVNWGIYESAYFANERGVLGDPEWLRFQTAICRRYASHQSIWNAEGFTSMDELLTPQFTEFVKRSCTQKR